MRRANSLVSRISVHASVALYTFTSMRIISSLGVVEVG